MNIELKQCPICDAAVATALWNHIAWHVEYETCVFPPCTCSGEHSNMSFGCALTSWTDDLVYGRRDYDS